MKKNKTAVEYFAERILSYKSPTNLNGTDYVSIPINKIEFLLLQAKKMEKEQIMDAWKDGSVPDIELMGYAEKYYNETYNQ